MTKFILPALLVFLLCAVPFVLASPENSGGVHEGAQIVTESGGGHEALQAGEAAAVHDGMQVKGHGEHATAEHNAHESGHGDSLSSSKLKDLFWRTVNFIALVVILVKFLAKPIGSGLSGRQQQVRDELESLKAKRDEAERSYKEFETRLAGMETEMENVVKKAIAQAENEKERILNDAEKAAEDIKRQAEAAVHAEMVEARRLLRNEVADQAAAMAEELIVKNLTPEDQVTITEQYLDRVGAAQ